MDANFWETSLGVDAALQHLARQVYVPLEDSTTFKDPMDRHADADLKKIYSVAGAACCLTIALASKGMGLERGDCTVVWRGKRQNHHGIGRIKSDGGFSCRGIHRPHKFTSETYGALCDSKEGTLAKGLGS